jgi:hypothetical protein
MRQLKEVNVVFFSNFCMRALESRQLNKREIINLSGRDIIIIFWTKRVRHYFELEGQRLFIYMIYIYIYIFFGS